MNKLIILLSLIITSTITHAIEEKIYGLWAMTPLKNGIANVIEYNKNGESINYKF